MSDTLTPRVSDTFSRDTFSRAASAAPGPAMLLAFLAALIVPLLLAALLPRLPLVPRTYLAILPLPLLEIECALALALLVLPAFKAPPPDEFNPALAGLARGVFAGLVALPFVLAARADAPMPLGAVLAGCALVAGTGAGAAAASAAFGPRGIAVAMAAAALPGVVGYFGEALGLPLGWLARLSPFLAADSAALGEAAWTLGLLPGLALIASAGLIVTKRT